jgi:hypothetical protein
MSAKIKFSTSLGPILIEFLENDFTELFLAQLKATAARSTCIKIQGLNNASKLKKVWDQNTVDGLVSQIRDSIDGVNNIGLCFPIAPKNVVFIEGAQENRQLLNRLHRYFTTGQESLKQWDYHSTAMFPVDVKTCYPLFTKLIHQINESVHKLESFVPSDRRRKFPKETEYNIVFNVPEHDPAAPTNDGYFYYREIPQEYYKFFSNQLTHDVWLPLSEILGKDYKRAYWDYDDPTNQDVSINKLYSGSMLVSNMSDSVNPDLESWLRSYGIEPGPMTVGMPLGNITQGKDLIARLSNQTITLEEFL